MAQSIRSCRRTCIGTEGSSEHMKRHNGRLFAAAALTITSVPVLAMPFSPLPAMGEASEVRPFSPLPELGEGPGVRAPAKVQVASELSTKNVRTEESPLAD